jgi:uncharacterized protein (DUF169 family)
MNAAFKNKFIRLWKKYFNNAELPITFYYTDEKGRAEAVRRGTVPRCIIGAMAKIEQGESLAFDVKAVGCPGGKRYLGFTPELPMPDFEYFLSCGIPGKLEGERYKKTPEMVKEYMKKHAPAMKASAKYIVFKRWDKLTARDNPEVVVFFARADVLAGLFTLASFDEAEQNMVIAPFGSGCASIVQYPYLETKSARPRAIIGMFDVSARPYVKKDTLSFATPMSKFKRMVDNMEESFLITPSWAKIQKRIK